jgi:hypothetical protein
VSPELLVADSWMTLVAGREIVAHGLPSAEALTTLAFGRSWTDQQWLAQLTFYGTERLGGLRLALLLDVLLVVAAFGLAMTFARARGGSARSTLFASTAAMLMAPWGWQLRAQSFALPLFVGVLGLVSLDPAFRRRRTWLAFPLLVVWANLHGSVIVGAAIVTIAGLTALARALAGRRNVAGWRMTSLIVLPWACVLCSPYALDLPAYYRLLLIDSPVSKVIREWQAPTPSGWMLFFFATAVATVAIVVWQRRRLAVADICVLALTLVGSLRSTRGIVWFALAAAVLLPVAMDGAFGGDRGTVRRRLGVMLSVGFGGVALVALVATVTRPASWFVQSWPSQALPRIAAATRDAGGRAAFPSDKHADWLLWSAPELRGRVAYDVRFELLTDAEIRAIVRYKSLGSGWNQAFDGYRVVLVDRLDTPRHSRALAALGAQRVFRSRTLDVLVLPRRS